MLHCFDKLVGLPALPPGCQHYDYDDYDDDDDDGDVDDDIYIMVKCLSVCHVFAYFIFSHFWALLGLEIREKVSRNRRNEKKCLEMGENIFSHF